MRIRTPVSWLVAAGLASCATPPHKDAAAEPATRLTATLVSPTDIALEWEGGEPDAAGRVVEFATEPDGRYTILQFVPARQTTFAHADLMPETPFYYRVRPFYGPASRPVEVALPTGGFSEKDQAGKHEWAYPRTVPRGTGTSHSIRAADSASATPTDLSASIVHANGIQFTWADHASDEEGYLLEVKPAGRHEFGAAAVLDPDINSFGLITLPTEKTATYRVRPFYYGKSSNVAHQTTGPDG
jgi:hypothetical protein